MRARRVKRLDPSGSFGDNVRRIARVRLRELWSFAPRAQDPAEVEALHDMRIAAKRLRYVLEMAEPALGEPARAGAGVAKDLQDLLGEIHDCDEAAPLVRRHIERLRAEDAAAIVATAGEGAEDVEAALAATGPGRRRYRGLEALLAHLSARRTVLYARFLREWAQLEESGFREQLEAGIATDPRARDEALSPAQAPSDGARSHSGGGAEKRR